MPTTTTAKKATKKTTAPAVEAGDLREMVEVRAYFLSQQAGFEAGREMDFWLQAESETLATLAPPKPARKPRAKKEAVAE